MGGEWVMIHVKPCICIATYAILEVAAPHGRRRLWTGPCAVGIFRTMIIAAVLGRFLHICGHARVVSV
jgi:hypothetical protein